MIAQVVFNWIIALTFLNLGLALICAFVRLIKGPSLSDRVVALDLIAILSAGLIGVYSVAVKVDAYIDVSITISLIAFLGTVAFARYIQRVGERTGAEFDDR